MDPAQCNAKSLAALTTDLAQLLQINQAHSKLGQNKIYWFVQSNFSHGLDIHTHQPSQTHKRVGGPAKEGWEAL